MQPLRLGPDGYFHQPDGQRVVLVGANYWPAGSGVAMWQDWPADQIQHDLDLLIAHGLNSLRFFLLWPDVHPEPDTFTPAVLDRLDQLLGWCTQRCIYTQPTLFTGFMSGGLFWPAWKAGRSLYEPGPMRVQSVRFARAIAQRLAPHASAIACIDLGNELVCLPDSAQSAPKDVADWCAEVCLAIRLAWPDAQIISGNEQNQIVADRGWRLGQQPGTDLYSMHGYPVPAWHPVPFDGMADPLARELLPLYTRAARAFGPVMLQEFGTILCFDPARIAAYLEAILPACWEAGANGFLWWCLRDIHAHTHPYRKVGMEQSLGLLDHVGRVKPGLEVFTRFAQSVQNAPAPPAVSERELSIYWPDHYYAKDAPQNPGNQPESLSRRIIAANHMLVRQGRLPGIARRRGEPPGSVIHDHVRMLWVPGAWLDQLEAHALAQWVHSGGRLVLHGIGPYSFGPAMIDLTAATPQDFRHARPVKARFASTDWTLHAHPAQVRLQVQLHHKATCLATDEDGLPVVWTARIGTGRVVAVAPQVDEQVAQLAGEPARRAAWDAWYHAILQHLLA